MSELATTETPGLAMLGLDAAQISQLDTDAMQALLKMKREEDALTAEKAFNAALAKAQAEMPTIKKERQGRNYLFAAFDDVWKVARPILKVNGFAVSFSQSETENDITVICVASHVEGHTRETPFTLPKDGPLQTKDGRNIQSQAQAQGSANSYAKRYCFCNAFNIVVSDEDDDAVSCAVETISQEEATAMLEAFDQVGDDVKKRCLGWAGVESADEFPRSKYAKAMKMLRDKAK